MLSWIAICNASSPPNHIRPHQIYSKRKETFSGTCINNMIRKLYSNLFPSVADHWTIINDSMSQRPRRAKAKDHIQIITYQQERLVFWWGSGLSCQTILEKKFDLLWIHVWIFNIPKFWSVLQEYWKMCKILW